MDQAEETAQETAGLHGLDRFPHPDWRPISRRISTPGSRIGFWTFRSVTLSCLTRLPRSGVCWRRPNLHGRRVAFIPWRSLWMSSRCGTRVRRRFKMEDTAAPLLALAGPNVLYGRLTAGGARVRTSSAIARRPSLRRMCKGCRPTNGRSIPLIRTKLPDHRRCRCCMTAQALRRRILRLART